MFLIDCHYYFPQSSIDQWNAAFPSTEWYIGGMNYIDHPMKATVWKGEAELTVKNTPSGVMAVSYKPRANKEYTHPLRNVCLTKATCLLDIPVESTHGGMETIRFFAIQAKRPIIHTIENLLDLRPCPYDLIRKNQISDMTSQALHSLCNMTKTTPSQLQEALGQKEGKTVDQLRWAKLLTNRESSWSWEYGYEFVPKTPLQSRISFFFSLFALVLPVLIGEKAMDLKSTMASAIRNLQEMAPSRRKSQIVTHVAWLMAQIWDGQEIGSLSKAPFWNDLSSFIRLIYFGTFMTVIGSEIFHYVPTSVIVSMIYWFGATSIVTVMVLSRARKPLTKVVRFLAPLTPGPGTYGLIQFVMFLSFRLSPLNIPAIVVYFTVSHLIWLKLSSFNISFTHEKIVLDSERYSDNKEREEWLTKLVADRTIADDADEIIALDILIDQVIRFHRQDVAQDGVPGTLRSQHRQKIRDENVETSLLLPLLCQWLFMCAVSGLILSQVMKWISLPVDIFLYFLGRSGDEKTIGRIEGFTY